MGPRRLGGLIAFVVTTGIGGAGVAWWQALHQSSQPPAARLVVVAVLVASGDIPLLRVRYGGQGNSFTWAEASLVVGAVAVDWSWITALGAGVILVRQLLTGRPALKAAYNAGAFASGAWLGRVAYYGVTGSWHVPQQPGWPEAVGLVVAAAVIYFGWNSVLVAGVVALSHRAPFPEVWRKGSVLRLVMFAGNTAAGLGVVLVGRYDVRTVTVLVFFVLALYLSYNSYVRAQMERDTWRDLQRAVQDLNRMEPAAVAAAATRGARTLFGAEQCCLLLADDPPATILATERLRRLGASGEPLVLEPGTLGEDLRTELADLRMTGAVLAPLEGVDRPLGTMLLGFGGRVHMRRRELGVLATYAGQVASSFGQAQLFAQMRAQRRRLAVIVDNASDGILLLRSDGTVQAWNPAMAELTARDEADALGRDLVDTLDAVIPGGGRVTSATVFAALAQDAPSWFETRVRAGPTGWRDVELSVSGVPSVTGRAEYAVVLARDVTARRELEQAKQDFVATVSHELRTPLTPIKGWLSILLRSDYRPTEDERRTVLRQLLDQALALERLVEDLLSVSRMSRGHFDITLRTEQVDRVVERAVEDMSHASRRAVVVRPGGPQARAAVDAARLQQVVANLLSNADKYSPTGRPVHVTVQARGDVVAVAVRDFGPGIPLAARAAVFEPFRRLGAPLTRETRGTGLGLHITRGLVEAMAGRVSVVDVAGPGACFVVELPLATGVLAKRRATEGAPA